ncbi:MAG: hypothetical protein GY940_06150 [bacterium]|nr:hypothetical protein [bacterium]
MIKKNGKLQKETEKSEVKMNRNEAMEISLLVNAIFYFIEHVFILKVPGEGGFRLVAFHKGRVLTDENYKTARGARIAFSKMYHYKAWKEDVKPDWSHFYDPDQMWLNDKTGQVVEKIKRTIIDMVS